MARKPVSHSAATKTPTPVAAAKPPPAARTASGAVYSPPSTVLKPTPASSLSPRSSPQEIIIHVWNKYLQDTPSRTMLLDAFLAWLVVVGAVQFLYCVLAGNYVRVFRQSWNLPTHATLAETLLTLAIAFQCLFVGVLRRGRPVCPHSITADADLRTTTCGCIDGSEEDYNEDHRRCEWVVARRWRGQHRKSICGFRLWKSYSTRLLCQLHQLEEYVDSASPFRERGGAGGKIL